MGAAVGAGVAAIANQLFRSLVSASADKLKELSPYVNGSEATPGSTPNASSLDASKPNANTTTASASNVCAPNAAQGNPYEMLGNTARAQKQGARIAPDYYRQLQKDQQIRYRTIAVGIVVAALVAVGVTAWLVDTLSAGQGFGTKVYVPVISQPETPRKSKAQQPAQTEQQQAATPKEKAHKPNEHSSESHKPSTDEKSATQQEQQNATSSGETSPSSENKPSNNSTGDDNTSKKPSEQSNGNGNGTNSSNTNNSQNNSNNTGDTKTNSTTP